MRPSNQATLPLGKLFFASSATGQLIVGTPTLFSTTYMSPYCHSSSLIRADQIRGYRCTRAYIQLEVRHPPMVGTFCAEPAPSVDSARPLIYCCVRQGIDDSKEHRMGGELHHRAPIIGCIASMATWPAMLPPTGFEVR